MSNVKKADRTKPLEHFYCIICGEEISKERIVRKAVTCSEAHGILLRNERRRLRDLVRCRLCNRPSTPEERAEFAAWRRENRIKPGPKPKAKDEDDDASSSDAPSIEEQTGEIEYLSN